MASKIKIKRSAVAGKVPLTTDLELSELAVNTNDGRLYTKKDNGTESIVEIGGPDFGSRNVTTTGTSTAASFTPTSSTVPTNGLYLPSAGSLAISTNSSERIRIGANGEVGIGGANYGTSGQVLTSGGSGAAPSWQTLSVSANSITQGNTSATVIDTGSDGRFVVTTEGSERARVDSSGRLLVGTSSARTNINVLDQPDLTPSVQFEGQSTSNRSTGLSIINYSASSYGPTLTLGASRSDTLGTNALVLNTGDLGTINFVGADGTRFLSGATISARADGTTGSGDLPTRLAFATTADGASSPTERMRIDSSGRLLVGTTSALGPSTTSTGITFFPGDYSVMSSAGNEPLTLNRNNDGAILSCRRSGTNVGSISVTTTATAFNTSSDYRLKENVTLLTGATDRLKQLPVHRFNFIADPAKTVDGFLAHEAADVVPECVTGEKDAVDDEGNPQYQGIDQSKLVPLLTAALQEAIGEIESLKARVVVLENA